MAPLPEWLPILLVGADAGGLFTRKRATAPMSLEAVGAGKEQFVAIHVGAIVIDVVWFAAVGTMADRLMVRP